MKYNDFNISLCMTVLNEEKFISNCINSVKNVMGIKDIIVADNGSGDKTKELALRCGAKVFDFSWRDDFSEARNFASEKALNDWIFFIDADEVVSSADMGKLADFIKDEAALGSVNLIEMTDKSSERLIRLYNKAFYRFEGTIHEQLRPIGKEKPAPSEIPVTMHHYGKLYRNKEAADQKYGYYIELLKKELEKKPGDHYLLCQLGKVYAFFPEHIIKACECFEQVLSSGPDLKLSFIFGAVVRYGYSLINTAQYEKAMELVSNYREVYEGFDDFRFLLAQAYQNSGMLIEAVEAYESCLNTEIPDAKGINTFLSFYNIGVILETIGMKEDAINMYLQCGDYEPALNRLKAGGTL